MAATIYKDRILETSLVTGTGPVALAGPVNGYGSFTRYDPSQSGIPVLIEAVDASNAPTGEWEVVTCTLSADKRTLTRNTVRDSSNAGAAVSFTAGTKRVHAAADGMSFEDKLSKSISAASRLLGRGSAAGAGPAEEIVLGSNLQMAGTTLGLMSLSGLTDGAKVRKAVTLSGINLNGGANVTWDTENWDTGNYHDNAVNTDRLTVTNPGYYECICSLNHSSVTASQQVIYAIDRFNSAGVYQETLCRTSYSSVGGNPGNTINGTGYFNAGDYATVNCLISTDTSVDIRLDSCFEIRRVVFGGANPTRGCLVGKTGNQAGLNLTTAAVLTWDANVWDTDGIHSTTVNTSRLTVPANVTKARVTCNVHLAAATSNAVVVLEIIINGGGVTGYAQTRAAIPNTGPAIEAQTGVLPVNPGDYLEARLTVTSGTVTIGSQSWIQMEIMETAPGAAMPYLPLAGGILTGGLTINTTLSVLGAATLNSAIVSTTLSVLGNVTLGDAVTDTHTINGTTTIQGNTALLLLKDSVKTGTASIGYVDIRDSANTRYGWMGKGSGLSTAITIAAEPAGGIVELATQGVARLTANPTNVEVLGNSARLTLKNNSQNGAGATAYMEFRSADDIRYGTFGKGIGGNPDLQLDAEQVSGVTRLRTQGVDRAVVTPTGLEMPLGYKLNNQTAEKSFIVNFSGAANQKVQVYWPTGTRVQGMVEVTVSAGYNAANISGYMRKTIGVYIQENGTSYNQSFHTDAEGAAYNAVTISHVLWDATNSRPYIVIANLTGAAHDLTITVRTQASGMVTAAILQMAATNMVIGAPYTTDATVFASIPAGINYGTGPLDFTVEAVKCASVGKVSGRSAGFLSVTGAASPVLSMADVAFGDCTWLSASNDTLTGIGGQYLTQNILSPHGYSWCIANTKYLELNTAGLNIWTGTTASGANVYQGGSLGYLYRSTSALRYKREVEEIDPTQAHRLRAVKPIQFKSRSEADDPDAIFYGFIAEEVEQVGLEPLIHYSYQEDQFETVEDLDHERFDPDQPALKRVIKEGEEKRADGVQYERVVVLQQVLINELFERLQVLEAKARI